MNKLKFFNSYKYWVFVIFMAMTGQTNAQPASAFITSSPKYKTLIVEKIYPFSIKEYVPAVNVTQISEATENTSPEEVVFALIASMKEAKYDWNNSLWTLDSRTQMKSRENAAGQTKEYWENLWGGKNTLPTASFQRSNMVGMSSLNMSL